jgi:hypothetical protein
MFGPTFIDNSFAVIRMRGSLTSLRAFALCDIVIDDAGALLGLSWHRMPAGGRLLILLGEDLSCQLVAYGSSLVNNIFSRLFRL